MAKRFVDRVIESITRETSNTPVDVKLRPELDKARLQQIVAELQAILAPMGGKWAGLEAAGVQIGKLKAAAKDIGANDLAATATAMDALSDAAERLSETSLSEFKNDLQAVSDLPAATGQAAQDLSRIGEIAAKKLTFNESITAVQNLTGVMNGLMEPLVKLNTVTQQMKALGVEAAAMAPRLEQASILVGMKLGQNAADIQQSAYDALVAGVKGGEKGLLSFAETAAKFAVGTSSSLSEATALLTGSLNAYGASSEEALKYADSFTQAIGEGVFTASEYAGALANIASTASAVGVSQDVVNAGVAMMTQKFVPASTSTNQLRQLLLEIAKPAADLAPILQKAGVSLESLKQEELPAILARINQSLKDQGKAAAEVFGSAEALSAFNILAEDTDNFADTLTRIKGATGTVDFAYAQMSDGIATRTKSITSLMENLYAVTLNQLGPGFAAVTQSAGQIAPTIATLAGVKQLIPEPVFVRAAAGFRAVWSAASGPIGLVTLGIAGVATAMHFLSDALHETAKEKVESASANAELLQEEYKVLQAKEKDMVVSRDLANQYLKQQESLGGLKQGSDEYNKASERLADLRGQLASRSPEFAQAMRSGASEIENLKKTSSEAGDKLAEMGKKLLEAKGKIADQEQFQLYLNVDVEKEGLENVLTDIKSSWLNYDQPFEWLFGTSNARQDVEAYVKTYSDAVYKSGSSADVTNAKAEFIARLRVDAKALDLSPQEQKQVIDQAAKVAQARIDAIEKAKEKERKALTDQQNQYQGTFSAITSGGATATEALDKMSKAFGKGKDEIRDGAISAELQKNAGSAEYLAKKYGASVEHVQSLKGAMKDVKDNTDQAVVAAKTLGDAFSEAQSAAKTGFDKTKIEVAALLADGKKATDQAVVDLIAQSKAQKATYRESEAALKEAEKLVGSLTVAAGQQAKDLSGEIATAAAKLAAEREKGLQASLSVDAAEIRAAIATRAAKLAEIEAQITATEKLTGVSAEQKTALLAIQRELLATEQADWTSVLAVRAKQLLAEHEAALAAEKKAGADRVAVIRANAEMTEAAQEATLAGQMRRTKALSGYRQDVERAESAARVEALIDQNARVTSAWAAVQDAAKRGAIEEMDTLMGQFTVIRAEVAATDALVNAERTKTGAKLKQISRDANAELDAIAAKAGSTVAEIERNTEMLKAKSEYDAALAAAADSAALQTKALDDYETKVDSIIAKYRQSSAVVRYGNALRDGVLADLKMIESRDQDRVKNTLAAINAEEKALLDSRKRKEISYESYVEKLNELDQKRAAAEKSGFSVSGALQKGLLDGSALVATEMAEKTATALKKLSREQERSVRDDAKLQEARTETYEAMAYNITATMAQAAIAGQDVSKAFANSTLDMASKLLTAQIPAFVAMIFGQEVAKLSFAGIATASVLTGMLYALVGQAKSALGRKDGEALIGGKTVDGLPATGTSDNILRFVSAGEGIITARANAATIGGISNSDAIAWANATNRPFAELYAKEMRIEAVPVADLNRIAQAMQSTKTVNVNQKTHIRTEAVIKGRDLVVAAEKFQRKKYSW